MPNRRPKRFALTLLFGATFGLGSALVSELGKRLSSWGTEYASSFFSQMRKGDRLAFNLAPGPIGPFEARWPKFALLTDLEKESSETIRYAGLARFNTTTTFRTAGYSFDYSYPMKPNKSDKSGGDSNSYDYFAPNAPDKRSHSPGSIKTAQRGESYDFYPYKPNKRVKSGDSYDAYYNVTDKIPGKQSLVVRPVRMVKYDYGSGDYYPDKSNPAKRSGYDTYVPDDAPDKRSHNAGSVKTASYDHNTIGFTYADTGYDRASYDRYTYSGDLDQKT